MKFYQLNNYNYDTSKNMLVGEIVGGLGNQLFLMAVTYVTAIENNMNPIFKFTDKNRTWNQLFKNNFRLCEYENNVKFIIYECWPRKFMNLYIPKNVDVELKGYFQTARYFDKYKSDILDIIKLTDEENELVENYIKKLREKFKNKKLIGVHIRRTDFVKLNWCLPITYYRNAIQSFEKKKYEFIFFSDDTQWCLQNFTEINICDDKFNDYIEMYILSKMDGYIMSNSTFNWWSVYIGKQELENKEIIIPNDYKYEQHPDIWCKIIDN